MLRINDRIAIPTAEFRFEFSRSGGPGGQNVNKVNSKAVLRWNIGASPSLPGPVRARLLGVVGDRLTADGDLLVGSQRTRDQSRNVADCLDKVRALILAVAEPPKARRATRPTYASQVRRVDDKVKRSASKRLRRRPELD